MPCATSRGVNWRHQQQSRCCRWSPFDDRVRLAEYRAIYRRDSLSRYGMGTQPSIRILVKNGNVTLDGVVDNQMDRNLAGIYANGVPGVFLVTNNLRVAGS